MPWQSTFPSRYTSTWSPLSMPRLSTVLNAGCRTRFAPESLESVIASPAARDAISSRASLLDYSLLDFYKEFIKHILRIARSMASEKAGPSHNRSFSAGPLASLPWARAFASCRSRLRCPVLSFVNLGSWRLRLSKWHRGWASSIEHRG